MSILYDENLREPTSIGVILGLIAMALAILSLALFSAGILPDNRPQECKVNPCENKQFHCFNDKISLQRCELYWLSRETAK
jgi:hypothetical protein